MFTRRRFLWSSTAALIVSRAPKAFAFQRGQRGRAPVGALPASIAALPSMKSQVTPITNDERRARLDKARRLMTDNHVDAILMSGSTSLVYFTNIHWGGGERLFACVIPAKGQPFFVCPFFERDRAHEQIALGPFGEGTPDVRTWNEDESPYALVAAGLKDRGISTGTLGIEETTKFVWADSIAQAAPQVKLVNATPVTAGCRMIKTDHELALMKLANHATLSVYAAVYHALQPGMTQNTVSGLIDAAYSRVGFPGGASVQVGEYTALPHGSIQPQTIKEGTIIMVDDGCTVEGYQSDITRTFVLGKPTDKMKKIFDIVKEAQTAALHAAKPGVPLESIDAAARKVIADAGYGPGFKYFSHRLGHGIGMDGHEWPYL
ncbi:MAG: M24 family metallopeptidase, partial [Vicinamibacterales bacterium]